MCTHAKRRALRRASRRLWTTDDPFDFDDKEPPDYYRVYLEDDAGEAVAQITACRGDELDVKLRQGDSFVQQDTRTFDEVLASHLTIFRRYHGIRIKYRSASEFVAKDWWYPFFVRTREWFLQKAYEQFNPIRGDRLDVLRIILEKRLNDNDYNYIRAEDTINEEEIAVRLLGRRALSREKDGGRLFSRINLILKSLVESGDIEKVGEYDTYRALGQAITTLSQAEAQDRRHRDTKRLTGALIFVGAVQVIVSLLQIAPIREWLASSWPF